MATVPLLKTVCNPDFKNKVTQFCKKKGETESAIIRKAVIKYMETNEAPK